MTGRIAKCSKSSCPRTAALTRQVEALDSLNWCQTRSAGARRTRRRQTTVPSWYPSTNIPPPRQHRARRGTRARWGPLEASRSPAARGSAAPGPRQSAAILMKKEVGTRQQEARVPSSVSCAGEEAVVGLVEGIAAERRGGDPRRRARSATSSSSAAGEDDTRPRRPPVEPPPFRRAPPWLLVPEKGLSAGFPRKALVPEGSREAAAPFPTRFRARPRKSSLLLLGPAATRALSMARRPPRPTSPATASRPIPSRDRH